MISQDGTSRRASSALALLVCINLFNYIDRQVLAAVESGMEETFFPIPNTLAIRRPTSVRTRPSKARWAR